MNIYLTYTVLIIIVHNYTLFLKQHITWKTGLENYLNEIYNIIETKCQQLINNYINVLSRNDGKMHLVKKIEIFFKRI